MYNFDVLQDVQFWRDYLSGSSPRIIARFGGQALVIENDLISTTVTWPAVRDDLGNRLQATYEDDLFSLADLQEIESFEDFEAEESDFPDEDEPDKDFYMSFKMCRKRRVAISRNRAFCSAASDSM